VIEQQFQPRIVILTRQDSPYGRLVLKEALHSGLPIIGVVEQEWGFLQKKRHFQHYARKVGYTNVLLVKLIEMLDREFLANKLIKVPEPELTDIPTFPVKGLNDPTTVDLLCSLQLDLILLAGVGIVRESILSCAAQAVINAHSGIVPEFRGNYTIRWAIYFDRPLGIAVHKVDTGVDTGSVLAIHPLSPMPCRSLLALEWDCECLRAKYLIMDTLAYLKGDIHLEAQSPGVSQTYSFMPARQVCKVYQKIKIRSV
jgi:hypothetical protein